MAEIYDIVVIGAGAVGCAVARELSRYNLKVAVLEKGIDVASGTSGRNSAVIHAGFNNKNGSLMAQLCVEGNQGFEKLANELGVPYKKTGKYLIAFDKDDIKVLKGLVEQGRKNGVKGLHMIDECSLKKAVPGVGGIAAMHSPETAIINPFAYVIALAEDAARNGVTFLFDREVKSILFNNDIYLISAGQDIYKAKFIINCAGLYSDKIANMMNINDYKIYPCRGEYFILDEIADEVLSVPIYPAPKKGIGGLGVHLTPTTKGNILIGPSAEYIDDKSDYSCTAKIMDKLFTEAKQLLPTLKRSCIIGSYSGIRSKLASPQEGGFHDFVIHKKNNSIHLIGIESPGLTASVPLARRVIEEIKKSITMHKKTEIIPPKIRKPHFRNLSMKEKSKLISQDSNYGEIVCRCEQITKREILDAIENPLGVVSISGIKYRCGATMGRCQGGYCLGRITDILIKEYNKKPSDITLRGGNSSLYLGFLQEDSYEK